MQQTSSDYRLIALFDRLASIGRAVRSVREQKETGPGEPVAKQNLSKAGQKKRLDKPAALQDSTTSGGSQQA